MHPLIQAIWGDILKDIVGKNRPNYRISKNISQPTREVPEMLSHQSENQVDHMEKYDDNDDDLSVHAAH